MKQYLGKKARCKVTRIKGIVVAICMYLYSSTVFRIEYKDNEGNKQGIWLEFNEMEIEDEEENINVIHRK